MTIDDNQRPFTVLIEFDVPPERQHELATRLAAQIDETLPSVKGFISAAVQASVDGHKVINYANWTSREAWETATGLDAENTGDLRDQNWIDRQSDRWFDGSAKQNPVFEILSEVGGEIGRASCRERV